MSRQQQVIAAYVFVVTATMAGLLVAGATDRLPPPGPEALLGLMAVPCLLLALVSLFFTALMGVDTDFNDPTPTPPAFWPALALCVVSSTMSGLFVAGATDRLPPPGPEALLGLMAVPCVLVALLSLGSVTDIVRFGGSWLNVGRPGRAGGGYAVSLRNKRLT